MSEAGRARTGTGAEASNGESVTGPHSDAALREELAAIESAWVAGGGADGGASGEEDDDGFSRYLPPRRRIFPPSFLFLVAAGLLFVSWESIADLRWTLFGPGAGSVIELGFPGNHDLDAARNDVRARVTGFASDRRGHFGRWFSEYEIFALQGLPILVQRPRGAPAPPNTAESISAEGRLLRLDDAGRKGAFGRIFSPVERYSAVRDQFAVLGELPLSGPTWLLLDGDIPRGDAPPVVLPIVVVLAAAGCVVAGLRSSAANLKSPWNSTSSQTVITTVSSFFGRRKRSGPTRHLPRL